MDADSYSFDIGPMGAIGEQGSLLLKINRNCPWNRCLFCTAYKGRRFEYRKTEELRRDVDIIRFLEDELKEISYKLGCDGQVNDAVTSTFILSNPQAYDSGVVNRELVNSRYASIRNAGNWLYNGGKSVFLQDADALTMRTPELIEVMRYLRESFPAIERITTFARSKTCARKSLEELEELRKAGLSRLLVGIESGYDPVLEYMQKGVTAQQHIEGGKKVVESGINLVTFIMPGLGGRQWTQKHIRETARLLNEIKPHLIRIRSLAIQEDSPLYQKWKSGEFEPLTDDQMVDEIEQVIEDLNIDSDIETGQLTNILFEIRGHLPQQKESILEIIRRYKRMLPAERLNFRFQRYLRYYLPYIKERGKADYQLLQAIRKAKESLEKSPSEAEQKVEEVILSIKQKGIP